MHECILSYIQVHKLQGYRLFTVVTRTNKTIHLKQKVFQTLFKEHIKRCRLYIREQLVSVVDCVWKE